MSALGQKQTFSDARRVSALLPKADIAEGDWHIRFVPKADTLKRRAVMRTTNKSRGAVLVPLKTRSWSA